MADMPNIRIEESTIPAKRPAKVPRAAGDTPPPDSTPDKPAGKRDTKAVLAPNTANDKLASQATSVLCGYNRVASIGATLFGLPETGDAIWNGNDEFSDLAFEALRDDPVLAKRITAVTGGSPGMLGLIIAYAALGSQVAGVAREEIAVRKARRLAEKEPDDGTRPPDA